MNRRSYGIGIGVGQFMAKRDLSKSDILEFFEKHCANENCAEECPFAEECEKVMELSNEELSLCSILGIEE